MRCLPPRSAVRDLGRQARTSTVRPRRPTTHEGQRAAWRGARASMRPGLPRCSMWTCAYNVTAAGPSSTSRCHRSGRSCAERMSTSRRCRQQDSSGLRQPLSARRRGRVRIVRTAQPAVPLTRLTRMTFSPGPDRRGSRVETAPQAYDRCMTIVPGMDTAAGPHACGTRSPAVGRLGEELDSPAQAQHGHRVSLAERSTDPDGGSAALRR